MHFCFFYSVEIHNLVSPLPAAFKKEVSKFNKIHFNPTAIYNFKQRLPDTTLPITELKYFLLNTGLSEVITTWGAVISFPIWLETSNLASQDWTGGQGLGLLMDRY